MILKDSFVTSPKILVWGDLGSFSWQMFHEVHKVGRSDQDAAQSSKFTISKFISNFFYHVSSAINNILDVLILETLNCEKSFMWTKFMNKNEKLKLMDSPSEGSTVLITIWIWRELCRWKEMISFYRFEWSCVDTNLRTIWKSEQRTKYTQEYCHN